jgi:hypothetical protein
MAQMRKNTNTQVQYSTTTQTKIRGGKLCLSDSADSTQQEHQQQKQQTRNAYLTYSKKRIIKFFFNFYK